MSSNGERGSEVCVNDPFDAIRASVSCLDIARHYGLTVNRSGFALCPWHFDRHPSLKLYDGDRGCWCFSCQHGGDVVELASGILGLSRMEAAVTINRDFGLGLSFGHTEESPAQRRERRRRREELERYRVFLAWLEDVQVQLCQLHRLGWLSRSIPPEEMTEDEVLAVREMPVVEYYLDVLADGQTKGIAQIQKGVESLCYRASKISGASNGRAS